MELNIRYGEDPFKPIMYLDGVISGCTASYFEMEIKAMAGHLSDEAVLDFTNLENINSDGLRLLYLFNQHQQRSGCRLKVVNPNPHVQELLTFVGLDRCF